MTFQGLSAPVVSAIYWYLAAISLALLGLVVIFVERYAAFRAFKASRSQGRHWLYVRLLGGLLLLCGMGSMIVASVKYFRVPVNVSSVSAQ